MQKIVNSLQEILLIVGVCLLQIGNSQTSLLQTSRSNLKLSVVDLFQSHYELSFEHKVDENTASFQITPSLYYRNGEVDRVLGYQLEWQFRKYFADWITQVPTIVWYLGFYQVGIRWFAEHEQFIMDTHSMTYSTLTLSKSIVASEGGGIIGAQLVLNKKLVADIQVGMGLRFSRLSNKQGVKSVDFAHRPAFDPGLYPAWCIQLGYLL